MPTQREHMLAGDLYDAGDPELAHARRRARDLLHRLNGSKDEDEALRRDVYDALFGAAGHGLWIEPPFYCDYGANIYLGDKVFFNFNCVILDPAEVRVGSHVLFGPAVQVYTATHPLDWRVRRRGLEAARPVEIGADVWIGGGAILCPGVRIGERAVIGAGAVVTKDVPAGTLAAGNPCRVIRDVA